MVVEDAVEIAYSQDTLLPNALAYGNYDKWSSSLQGQSCHGVVARSTLKAADGMNELNAAMEHHGYELVHEQQRQ